MQHESSVGDHIMMLQLQKALSVGGRISDKDERRLQLALFLRKLGLKLL